MPIGQGLTFHPTLTCDEPKPLLDVRKGLFARLASQTHPGDRQERAPRFDALADVDPGLPVSVIRRQFLGRRPPEVTQALRHAQYAPQLSGHFLVYRSRRSDALDPVGQRGIGPRVGGVTDIGVEVFTLVDETEVVSQSHPRANLALHHGGEASLKCGGHGPGLKVDGADCDDWSDLLAR